jgi:hypothetical protein
MVSTRFLRVDIDFEMQPEDFSVPGFVERQYHTPDFASLVSGDLTIFKVTRRGIPSRHIMPGDLLFVDLKRKQPGFGQPAVFADGTLDVFGLAGEVQGAVVALFRRVARQV